MELSAMHNDTIDLLKSDGTKTTGLKAKVGKNEISMYAKDILVEPQDLIIRRMSNGAEETYRVIDPRFIEAFHTIGPRYQMEVQKLGLPEAKSAVNSITYNITGNNARINQHSIDNSTNTVKIDSPATKYIEALRNEIGKSSLSDLEKAEAIEVIDELDKTFLSGNPKKPVVNALLNALPNVANAATIISAIAGLIGVGG